MKVECWQLFSSNMPTKELYKGSKNYWRLRANIDYHIIEHVELKVAELIAFHPDLNMENRLYLVLPLLTRKVDKSKVECLIAEKKEENLRRRKRVSQQDLEAEAMSGLLVDFILNRLNVAVNPVVDPTDSTKESQSFEVTFTPQFGDDMAEGDKFDFLLDAVPASLVPYPVERQKNSK